MEAYLSGEKNFVKLHFLKCESIDASLDSLLHLQTF
ncbi:MULTISPECIES: DUF5951 family protein [Citrobacter]